MIPPEQDIVRRYGLSKGWHLEPRTVLLEGTSDVALIMLAAGLFRQATRKDILSDIAIVAAGERDRGGTRGVIRELVTLRNLGGACLSPAGRPVYRFIGLFDDDAAGRQAVSSARSLDASIVEFRDLFRLRPVMPLPGNLDPSTVQRCFEEKNSVYKGISWELEDLVGAALFDLFVEHYPTAVIRTETREDAIHRELTRDGKHNLLKFCEAHADLNNLRAVVGLLHSLRRLLALPAIDE
ncbi:hypothetical protein [Erythrobacter donghaensis]|uniref:hypothetical protein n=1 Tax=Erythrobacter donghaensis TaxID=267135 RepID=UPI001302B125|nr:hypothetical protein [Erythrobacter donghaensis]